MADETENTKGLGDALTPSDLAELRRTTDRTLALMSAGTARVYLMQAVAVLDEIDDPAVHPLRRAIVEVDEAREVAGEIAR